LANIGLLPFTIKDPMDSTAFFKSFGSGVLLCKILNQIQPGAVNTRILKLHPRSVHEQIQNINLALDGAKMLGANFVNIQAEDVIEGSPLILSLIWKFIRMSGLKEVSLRSHPEIIHLMNPKEDPLEFVKNSKDKDGLLLRWVNANLYNAGLPPVANLGKDLANGKAILGVMTQVCPSHVFQSIDLNHLLSSNDPETRSFAILDIINKLDLEPILNEQNILAGNSAVNTLFLGHLFHYYPGLKQIDINSLTPHQLTALDEIKKQTKQEFDNEISQRFNRCSIGHINSYAEVSVKDVIDDEVRLIEERKKEFARIQNNLPQTNNANLNEPTPCKLGLDRLYEQCEYFQNAIKGMSFTDPSQYQSNVPLCTGMSKFKQVEEELLHSYSCLTPSTPDDERYYTTISIDENLLDNQLRDLIGMVTVDSSSVKTTLPVLEQVGIDIRETLNQLHDLFKLPPHVLEKIHRPFIQRYPVQEQQQHVQQQHVQQQPSNNVGLHEAAHVQNVGAPLQQPQLFADYPNNNQSQQYQQTNYTQPPVQPQMDFPSQVTTQTDFPNQVTTQMDFPGSVVTEQHIQRDFPNQNQYTQTVIPQQPLPAPLQNQYTQTVIPQQQQPLPQQQQYTQTQQHQYNQRNPQGHIPQQQQQQQQQHVQQQLPQQKYPQTSQQYTQTLNPQQPALLPQQQPYPYQQTQVTHQTGGYGVVQQPGYVQTVVTQPGIIMTHQPGYIITQQQQPGYVVTVTNQPGYIIETTTTTTMPLGRASTYEEEVARRVAGGMPLFS